MDIHYFFFATEEAADAFFKVEERISQYPESLKDQCELFRYDEGQLYPSDLLDRYENFVKTMRKKQPTREVTYIQISEEEFEALKERFTQ